MCHQSPLTTQEKSSRWVHSLTHYSLLYTTDLTCTGAEGSNIIHALDDVSSHHHHKTKKKLSFLGTITIAFPSTSSQLEMFHATDTKISPSMIDPGRISTERGVWIVVEEGDFKGMTMVTDRDSGDIVALSARNCNSEEKRSTLPSLKEYPSLKMIDLHNYRYMKDLDDSIGSVPALERLILTRCDLLQTLPRSIGNLHNLEEVSGLLRSVCPIRCS